MNRAQTIDDDGKRLDQFESEWLDGRPPDLVTFLGDVSDRHPRYLRDLIEIDLEYRWKAYSDAFDVSECDEHGFPAFPRVEDYAALLSDELRDHVLTPDLVGEEYRVRRRWGDDPDRQHFFQRFPENQAAIENALNGIDAEFEIEGIDVAAAPSSNSLANESTVSQGLVESDQSLNVEAPASTPLEVGKYRLENLVGRGGFGEVWKAYDPTLKRYVAVKLPRRDKSFLSHELSSFQREAEKLAMLGRVPGIVSVFECGEHKGFPYIVSDFIEGESLQHRLETGTTSHRESAHLVAEVAEALSRAHLQGLVHRDIKPQNILLSRDGTPFIADFGMCVTEEEQLREGHTTVGTYAYMSPEQARGTSQHTDGRADIYSLGVVLYRALTGRLPFVGKRPADYIEQVLHREPRPPRSIDPEIPAELERISLKCLRKDVADRYTTAGDLAADLRRFCATTTRPEGLAGLLAGRGRQLSLAAVLILALSALAVVISGSGEERREADLDGNHSVVPPTGETLAVAHDVMVITKPQQARVVVYPLRARDGLPDGARRVEGAARTPVTLKLEPGIYLVVAALDDGRFHEVFRTVPEDPAGLSPKSYRHARWMRRADGPLEWPEIEIPESDIAAGMGRFDGDDEFRIGEPDRLDIPQHARAVAAFYLDPHETTWGEFLGVHGQLPASLAYLNEPSAPGNYPISAIWYDDAVMYAEKVGKRLPTEAEYEFAATVGGTRRYPWGDDASLIQDWPFGPIGTPEYDCVETDVPIFGLYSNVAEWTSSRPSPYPPTLRGLTQFPMAPPGTFIVRGGPSSVIEGKPDPKELATGPRNRVGQIEKAMQPGLGFRCARSVRPRLNASDLEVIVSE